MVRRHCTNIDFITPLKGVRSEKTMSVVTIRFFVKIAVILMAIHIDLSLCMAGQVPAKVPVAADIINPHFTGKDCNVCHDMIPDQVSSEDGLRFGEDDVALCHSCHQPGKAKTDVHPVNVVAGETESIALPHELPLYSGKLTCRTCHEVYLQCKNDQATRFDNFNFLRGAPYEKPTEICFRCHRREVYTKTNPHKQKNEAGDILEDQCLYCHQAMPDPDTVSDIQEVNFKTATSTFCTACHGEKKTLHPAGVDHMVSLPQDMHGAWEEAQKRFATVLPLFKGSIFCGTCHNPHDTGVITRKEAATGSDSPNRLRLDWSFDLCVACHDDKADIQAETAIVIPPENLRDLSYDEPIQEYHKSFIEKKCRACHAITRESPQRPVVNMMCFQSGCHDASLIHETYKHGEALSAQCLLCHNQHGSRYGGHIANDQKKLCGTCHPMLGTAVANTEGKGEQDFHEYYYTLFKKINPEEEATCSFCHGEDHRSQLEEKGITSCYQCHGYIKELIAGKPGKPSDVHDTFQEEKCTACHDPHSSPFKYLLLEEPETYSLQ